MDRISPAMLRRALGDVRDSIQALDRTLSRLATGNGDQEPAGQTVRRTRRLSRKARTALVLQGRYMGYMRQLKPRQKAQVRMVKETKGVRAAIARAKSLAQ